MGQNQICSNHAQNERHAHEIKERKEEQGIREKTEPDDETPDAAQNTRKDSTAGSPRGPARFSVAAPDVQKQGAAAPIQGRGSLLRLQKGAGRHMPGTFLFPSFSTVRWSCDKKKEIERVVANCFQPATEIGFLEFQASDLSIGPIQDACGEA